MFPYSEQISQYTAAFPGTVYTPRDVRNMEPDGVLLVESGATPFNPGPGARLRVNLDQVPMEQAGMQVLVNGTPRTIIPYGEAPAAGEVAVSMTTGVMEFHESDEDRPLQVTYRGKGTPIMAHLFHQLGRELAAVQQRVKAQVLDGPAHVDPAQDVVFIPGSGRASLLKYGNDGSIFFLGSPFQLLFEVDQGSMRPRLVPSMSDSTAVSAATDFRSFTNECAQLVATGAIPSQMGSGFLGKAPHSNRTTNYTLTAADSGRTFTSGTGSTMRVFTLPAWEVGLHYRFIRTHNAVLRINASGTNYMAARNGIEPLASFDLTQPFQTVEIEAITRFEWDYGIYYAWVIRQFT